MRSQQPRRRRADLRIRDCRSADQPREVAPPLFEGFAPLLQILRVIVLAGDAALVPADVVHDRLDYVRLGKAQLVDVRDEGPAQIVQRPTGLQRRASALGYTFV
jgi:hypothetical protein